MMRNIKGQSTVEYILLATAVIAVIIVFTTNQNGLQGHLGNTLNTSINSIDTMSSRLNASYTTNVTASLPPAVDLDPTENFAN